jgi:hypothetical protein
MTLVSKTLPFALLLTSRPVNFEAKPYFASKMAILQESDRFYYVMDTDSIRLFYSFAESDASMMRIVLEEHHARDISHPLRILPEMYKVRGASIERGTQTYVDIQSFAKSCSTALLNKYPKTTMMAIRFEDIFSRPLRCNWIDMLEPSLCQSPWAKLLPGELRLRDVQTLIEEGHESPA